MTFVVNFNAWKDYQLNNFVCNTKLSYGEFLCELFL